jgi:3,4-dihydroxyphthalate decarboxylase
VRPNVGAIVHAHPPSLVLTSMAGIELKPVFGGYDPRAMRLALRPIPVFESSLTLHTKEQVHAMMAVMGDSEICIMRGHGVVVCGKNVEDATIKAIKLDALAEMNLQLARLGKSATISEADIAAFQNRTGKGDGSVQPVWRYYVEWLTKV